MNIKLMNKALKELRPGCDFSFTNTDLSTTKWEDKTVVTPTLKEVADKMTEIANRPTPLDKFRSARIAGDLQGQIDALVEHITGRTEA